jgi:hypothetical protein
MKPIVNHTVFGSITIDNKRYVHDVQIRLDGKIKKRKKKLSKAVYGTSHIISLEEAQHIFEPGAENLIIGGGQYLRARLSDKASEFFKKNKCKTALYPTQEAADIWNKTKTDKTIALFHITC